MTSPEILKADVLDILFENRNKQYGAYALRKEYTNRLGTALGIGITGVLLLVLLFRPGGDSTSPVRPDEGPVVKLTQVAIPEEEPKPQPKKERPNDPVKQRIYSDEIEITKDETDVAEQDDLKDAQFGNEIIDGAAATVDVAPDPGPPTETPAPAPNPEPPAAVEPPAPPQFPGGQQAWLDFLSRHLAAPDGLEPGEKKTVLVRFVVDEEGRVTGFVVAQSAGAAFDNEVIRVLKKMPRWKPARQNGQNITVPFTQPVTFMGVEE